MKLKATKKEIKGSGSTILKIGYCDAQYLLTNQSPFAYSNGVYGWCCDYYKVGNIIISTGYSPIGDSVNWELLQEYERKAMEIRHSDNYSADAIDLLLNEFIDEVTK